MQSFNKSFNNQSGIQTDNLVVNKTIQVETTNQTGDLTVLGNIDCKGTLKYNNGVSLIPSWSNPDGNGKISYSGGFVGVNQSSPTYPLDVFGIINADTDIYAGGFVGIGTQSPLSNLHIVGNQPNQIMTDNQAATNGKSWSMGPSYNNFFGAILNDNGSQNTIWLQAQRNGMNMTKVCFDTPLLGINNDNPNANLDVGGNIIASGNISCGSLNTSGKIGIGNNNPSYGLDIVGNVRIVNSTSLNPSTMILNNTSNLFTSGTTILSKIGLYGGSTGGSIQGFNTWGSGGGLIFNSNSNTSGADTERMRIHNNGNVGIKQSNPIYDLDVNGSCRLLGGTLFLSSNGSNYISNDSTNTTYSTNGSHIFGQSVGIKQSNPLFDLDINGSLRCSTININNAPMFSVFPNNYSHTTGKIQYNNIEFGLFNTSSYQFVAPFSGFYQFTVSLLFTSSRPNINTFLLLYMNNTEFRAMGTNGNITSWFMFNGSTICYLITNDVIDIRFNDSISISGGAGYNSFQGMYLRS